MTTLEILKAARNLISDPARWCQEDLAQDSTGEAMLPEDPRACKWCATGAVFKFTPEAMPIIDLLEAECTDSVIHVNDDLGHEAVLFVYDKAIAKLEGKNA